MANGSTTRTIGRVLPIETAIHNRNTDSPAGGAVQMQEVVTGDTPRITVGEPLRALTVRACRIVKALKRRASRETAGKDLPVPSMV